MDHELHMDGGPEEWLRRIAVSQSLAIVPDEVAAALVAIGFAQRIDDGSLTATAAGRVHLDARGIILTRNRERKP